ncbi:MAG: hypothetical protein COA85_03795 [Robiginitomaculum sp.]|nr:MAG: hypothetical protein COA85_03795 [Robiginitomaculum sp.]
MPKIFGLKIIGLLATSVAFFVLGWLWYGVLFMDKWATLMGVDISAGGEPSMLPMLYGFLNVVVVSFGIGLLLKWLKITTMASAVKYGLIAAVFFSLTTEAYGPIYGGTPIELLYINGAYNFIGYGLVAAIWSFFSE